MSATRKRMMQQILLRSIARELFAPPTGAATMSEVYRRLKKARLNIRFQMSKREVKTRCLPLQLISLPGPKGDCTAAHNFVRL
jgi:hypothetical protein